MVGQEFTKDGVRFRISKVDGEKVFVSKVGKRGRPSLWTLAQVQEFLVNAPEMNPEMPVNDEAVETEQSPF
jgi:hypothetical protein